MYLFTRRSIFIFLISLATTQLIAQEAFHLQQLDNRNGLSNSAINCIYQDSDKLLWIGTWDGLNMYDGSTFHVFNYSKSNNNNSIGSNIIYQILEDNKKNIWVVTNEGISKYQKNTGKFMHYFYNQSKVRFMQGFLIAVDESGNIYSSSKSSNVVNYYDETSDSFKPCVISNNTKNKIKKIVFDKKSKLWVLKQDGTLKVYVKNGQKFIDDYYENQIDSVDDFFYVNDEIFFTTYNKRLYKQTNKTTQQPLLILPKTIRSMAFYKDNYYFAWSSVGVGEYDKNFSPLNNLSNSNVSLSNSRITYLMEGNENILWAGTDGNGIISVSENINSFGRFNTLPNGKSLNIQVRAFNKVKDELWVGTKGSGIIAIKNTGKNNATSRFIQIFNSGTDLLDNCVYAIDNSINDLVYIGSDAPGLTVYNKKNNKFYNWNQITGTNKIPLFRSVHAILQDADSSIWLGTEAFGLIHLKFNKNIENGLKLDFYKQYSYTGTETGPGSDIIYSLAHGDKDQIWIGCRYGGLSLFDKKSKTFKTHKAFSYPNSLSNNDILSLFKDKNNRLWIGTSFGLNWLEYKDWVKSMPNFGEMNMENGLPNNTVHGITQDNHGDIWISTNKGLVRVNTQTFKNTNFKKLEELQSNEFSDNAVWKDDAGYLFFGGIYGFNYFMPEKIQFDTEQPRLLISSVKIADNSLVNTGLKILNLNDKSPINFSLKRTNNYFELIVYPIKFSNQEKWIYSYKLSGLEENWNQLGDDRRIIYNNIAPGNYTLLLKWSNGEGVWSDEVITLKVEIKQYPWLTYPALFVYFIIITMLIYFWYRYRRKKIIIEHQLSTELLLRNKDEELHQYQLNFFTNIAHELLTPLTLITGSLERYLYKNKVEGKKLFYENFLTIVNKQTSRLNYLIYQLLEFRKAEAGYLKNHYSKINISNLLFNIAELFIPLSEKNNLQFDLKIEDNIILWIDKDKVEKIIFNLLSNAFKHTCENQTIIVTLKANKELDKLQIEFSNSGKQLSQTELDKLFNKFIVLDNTKNKNISSGIGLAFSRELALFLNGDIYVTNQNNWIKFTLELALSFEPQEESKTNQMEVLDKPSYLLELMTSNIKEIDEKATSEINKYTLIKSIEDNNKKSILIIEDDASIRFLLNDLLKDFYLIYEAKSGIEALDLMKRSTPDLIISDIMMEDMNGLEICNIVKDTPATCHIPFIILSAKGSVDNKTEGYEAGADAYISKPFNAENLLVRIKKLIEYQDKLHQLFKQDRIIDNLPETGIDELDKIFLKNTIHIIENRIEFHDLDASYLEKELSMSRASFFRKVKALSGMTPGELIKNIRIHRTANLLKTTNLTVTEIFYQTGFANQSHFFRAFKHEFGCSPNDYRSKQAL